ncbi:unnamed protein product [Symbiodinium pilosum]|uniref:C3H1-type domain-containing protein n=1 Tax=Symbiodinium pilosum TaxID=2952 RepID=A0A812X3J5_SYMPI|nr:unnamed protein product [Symbiodinium pilosum]
MAMPQSNAGHGDAQGPNDTNTAYTKDQKHGRSGAADDVCQHECGSTSSSKSNGSTDASKPFRFWKPHVASASSSSVTSSEYWRAEADREECRKLAEQVPMDVAGKPTSVGSNNHPEACLPCVFFVTKCGCSRGVRCEFCHFPHPGRRRRRVDARRLVSGCI